MKSYSLLSRITLTLIVTMVIASICTFGWLYLKARSTDIELRQQTLLDQARMIASYVTVQNNGTVQLKLPSRLAEAYISPESPYRYAIRDANGQFLLDGKAEVGPLPPINHLDRKLYDYDPDGSGPLHVYGAALQVNIANRVLFVQVEQQGRDSEDLRNAVFDEFVTDGGWLEILILIVLLGVNIWIVRRAIAPLTRISKLAATVGPASASIRLPTDQVPLEILPLVRSMNSAFDRLEQGLQRQRDFNANAAHQLKTPLAVLMANMEMLRAAEPDIANKLQADVEHMSRIVSQLLLVAQLETLSINLDEIVDLNAASAEITASLAPLAIAADKSIELVRAEQPVVVRTSTFALRAALGNLIENAIYHTPIGTSVRVRITDRPSIGVMDSGPGIPTNLRTRIFERFWRSDQSKGGAGLGLAIVARIMAALHGSIAVDDAPGGGALFELYFPPDAKISKESVEELESVH